MSIKMILPKVGITSVHVAHPDIFLLPVDTCVNYCCYNFLPQSYTIHDFNQIAPGIKYTCTSGMLKNIFSHS